MLHLRPKSISNASMVGRSVAAESQRHIVLVEDTPDEPNEPQDGRVERLIMRDALVGSIDGQTALNQVVRANRQKISLPGQEVCRKCGGCVSDHYAHRHTGNSSTTQLQLTHGFSEHGLCCRNPRVPTRTET